LFIAFLLAHAVDSRVASAVVTTANSMDRFGHCFTETQERDGRAWSFVPDEAGGTFSNRGAAGVAAGYQLVFREGLPNRIRVTGPADELSRIAHAIQACR
jgi:hypothetical protein